MVIISHSGIREKKHHLESVLWLGAVAHIGNAHTWEGEVGREGCFKLKVSLGNLVRLVSGLKERKGALKP